MHLRGGESGSWYLFCVVKVKTLSAEPDLPEQLFENLFGSFNVRVCALNRAGCGSCTEESIILHGG